MVAHDLRLDELHDDILVRDAHAHAVLRRAILILVHDSHAAAGLVIGLTDPAAAVLDLWTRSEPGDIREPREWGGDSSYTWPSSHAANVAAPSNTAGTHLEPLAVGGGLENLDVSHGCL